MENQLELSELLDGINVNKGGAGTAGHQIEQEVFEVLDFRRSDRDNKVYGLETGSLNWSLNTFMKADVESDDKTIPMWQHLSGVTNPDEAKESTKTLGVGFKFKVIRAVKKSRYTVQSYAGYDALPLDAEGYADFSDFQQGTDAEKSKKWRAFYNTPVNANPVNTYGYVVSIM